MPIADRPTAILVAQLAAAIAVQPMIAPVGRGLEMSMSAARLEDAIWAELCARADAGETINL
jgi:hypothetical protein